MISNIGIDFPKNWKKWNEEVIISVFEEKYQRQYNYKNSVSATKESLNINNSRNRDDQWALTKVIWKRNKTKDRIECTKLKNIM